MSMSITRAEIERLFKVGQVIRSGGGKAEFRLTDILDDRVRIASTSSSAKSRVWYSRLSLVLETFDSINPRRIQSSIVDLLNDRALKFSQNESYVYGFALEYRKRTGIATIEDYTAELKEDVDYSMRLSPKKRAARIAVAPRLPEKMLVTTTMYRRNADVMAAVFLRANGVCEHCKQKAPFVRRDGRPYLEVHHVVRLASGGEDTEENAVALCPNCHRRDHYA
jgi:5-methylcytosine-specific restriction protein A